MIEYRDGRAGGGEGQAGAGAGAGRRCRRGPGSGLTSRTRRGRRWWAGSASWRVLRDALARVRAERTPQLVTLVGVPGIGKSRLVYELSRIADAEAELITWRQGRSLPYGDGVSFWALAEMVKAQAGILESDTSQTRPGPSWPRWPRTWFRRGGGGLGAAAPGCAGWAGTARCIGRW